MGFIEQIRTSETDEWYTTEDTVEIIVPYLKRGGHHKILCPWDTERSAFVKVLKEYGFDVTYSHIDTGTDFFSRTDLAEFDAVVSNPPFSMREKILERLFEAKVPFAIILNFNGLFDSRRRWKLFAENDFSILIPFGRFKFWNDGHSYSNPNFQSVYVCHGMTDKQIEFVEQPDRQVAMEI